MVAQPLERQGPSRRLVVLNCQAPAAAQKKAGALWSPAACHETCPAPAQVIMRANVDERGCN
eukprot:12509787-Alexandrium_andersonii.AAC.1